MRWTERLPHGARRRWLAATSFLATLLAAAPAHAHGPMGMQGLFEGLALLVGIGALMLSAALGAFTWAKALRPPTDEIKIFGRGFVGVSAVVAFAIGGFGITIGLGLWLDRPPPWVMPVVGILVLAFLATEFFITATLYRRANAHRPTTSAKLFSVLSYILGGLFSIVICLVGVAVAIPTPKDRPSAEVRRYQRGCDGGNASDCNMVGVRYRQGMGVRRDPAVAAARFRRSCELGASIGCSHLASMHSIGDGVEKDKELAAEYDRRAAEIDAKGRK